MYVVFDRAFLFAIHEEVPTMQTFDIDIISCATWIYHYLPCHDTKLERRVFAVLCLKSFIFIDLSMYVAWLLKPTCYGLEKCPSYFSLS